MTWSATSRPVASPRASRNFSTRASTAVSVSPAARNDRGSMGTKLLRTPSSSSAAGTAAAAGVSGARALQSTRPWRRAWRTHCRAIGLLIRRIELVVLGLRGRHVDPWILPFPGGGSRGPGQQIIVRSTQHQRSYSETPARPGTPSRALRKATSCFRPVKLRGVPRAGCDGCDETPGRSCEKPRRCTAGIIRAAAASSPPCNGGAFPLHWLLRHNFATPLARRNPL